MPASGSTRFSVLRAALVAAALAPYFVGLGRSSIWDANEAFYADTARVMVESGDYINPSFNGRPRFNKPPLCYWEVAASYHLFGVSEAAERLPIALGGLVLVGTALALARLAGSPRAGWLAALVLASTPRLLMMSRRIIIDVHVAAFMGLTLLCFALACGRPASRRLFARLMYVVVGLGVLTKGPVAAALPALTFLVWLGLSRRSRLIGDMRLVEGALIVLGIVAPWYAAVYQQHGWEYIRAFIVDENLGRFAEPMGSTPRRGWLFYLPVVLGDTFPWSLLLVPAAYATWRTWDAGPTREVREAPGGRPSVDLPEPARVDADIVRLLWTWIATIVLFFSFSSNKQDLYVLPAVPAAAALAGLALDAAIGHRVGGRVAGLARWTLVWCGLLLAAGGALILGLFVIGAPAYDLAGASTIAVVTLTGGAVAALVAMRGRAEAATLVLGATLVCFSWLFVLVALPDFERYKPVRPLAEIIRARAGPDATVGYYRFAVPSLAYYMRRPVFEYLDPSQLAAALAGGRPAYCLVAAHDLEPVRASLPDPVYILASRPMFDVKLAAVLRRDPLPRMLLVSNRP